MSKAETKFDLKTMLQQLNDAFLNASNNLRKEFNSPAWVDSPFIYHMPKMRISMQVALSYSDGSVHGNFITGKKTSKEEGELVTTIDIDLVSVPREVEASGSSKAQNGNSHQESGDGSGASSEDESGGEPAPPLPPPMPTTVVLPTERPMQNQVRTSLKKLGFTDLDPIAQNGPIFRYKARWQGKRKKLRINARDNSITEI